MSAELLSNATIAQPADTFTPPKLAIMAGIATALWLIAAMFIRFAGPVGAFAGLWLVITYALTVPLTWRSIVATRKALGMPPRCQTVAIVGTMSTVAVFLDGVAFTWFRSLYGPDPAVILDGASWLFWAIAVGLALGVAMSRERSGKHR